MEQITEYIKNIVFFLIFSSFIGIILPSGKYKNYISIVLGFILLFIVIEPVSAGQSSINKLVKHMEELMEESTTDKKSIINEEIQKDLILKNFKLQLQAQISVKAAEDGYKLKKLEADVNINDSIINRLDIWLSKPEASEIQDSAIYIEPVIIDTQVKMAENSENTESLAIKKELSDFYNISSDNIYIYIQKE